VTLIEQDGGEYDPAKHWNQMTSDERTEILNLTDLNLEYSDKAWGRLPDSVRNRLYDFLYSGYGRRESVEEKKEQTFTYRGLPVVLRQVGHWWKIYVNEYELKGQYISDETAKTAAKDFLDGNYWDKLSIDDRKLKLRKSGFPELHGEKDWRALPEEIKSKMLVGESIKEGYAPYRTFGYFKDWKGLKLTSSWGSVMFIDPVEETFYTFTKDGRFVNNGDASAFGSLKKAIDFFKSQGFHESFKEQTAAENQSFWWNKVLSEEERIAVIDYLKIDKSLAKAKWEDLPRDAKQRIANYYTQEESMKKVR
jgi:hypothetical protein